jgi:hypothetical protein
MRKLLQFAVALSLFLLLFSLTGVTSCLMADDEAESGCGSSVLKGAACFCCKVKIAKIPGNRCYYGAERYEEACSGSMKCSEPTLVPLLDSCFLSPFPQVCELGNCITGIDSFVSNESDGKDASPKSGPPGLDKPLPFNFKPKFPAGTDLVHEKLIEFEAENHLVLARVMLIKVPHEQDEVPLFAIGWEVKRPNSEQASYRIRNPKQVKPGQGGYLVDTGSVTYLTTVVKDKGK